MRRQTKSKQRIKPLTIQIPDQPLLIQPNAKPIQNLPCETKTPIPLVIFLCNHLIRKKKVGLPNSQLVSPTLITIEQLRGSQLVIQILIIQVFLNLTKGPLNTQGSSFSLQSCPTHHITKKVKCFQQQNLPQAKFHALSKLQTDQNSVSHFS